MDTILRLMCTAMAFLLLGWLVLFGCPTQATANAENVTAISFETESAIVITGLPQPYKQMSLGKFVYTYHYQDAANWADAQAFCGRYGGDLASVETKAIQRTLERLVRKVPFRDTVVWTAGHYSQSCDLWEWRRAFPLYRVFFQQLGADTIAYQYTKWAVGEPETRFGDCLGIDFGFGNRWTGQDCSNLNEFLCQWNECQRWTTDEQHCQRQRGCIFMLETNRCFREPEEGRRR